MRNYGRVMPTFWTGTTGRAIRAAGRDAQVVALYLITCPNANMIGLFYLPLPTLCHEVSITARTAMKTLTVLANAGFAYYDEVTAYVWVPEMARYQIGEQLKPGDKRIPAITKALAPFEDHPFAVKFVAKYAEAFALPLMPLPSPSEEPSKTLRSQEHEHEHEHEQEQAQDQAHDSHAGASHPTRESKPSALSSTVASLVTIYRMLPGVVPTGKDGGVIAGLVGRYGADRIKTAMDTAGLEIGAAKHPLHYLVAVCQGRKNGRLPKRPDQTLEERAAEMLAEHRQMRTEGRLR